MKKHLILLIISLVFITQITHAQKPLHEHSLSDDTIRTMLKHLLDASNMSDKEELEFPTVYIHDVIADVIDEQLCDELALPPVQIHDMLAHGDPADDGTDDAVDETLPQVIIHDMLADDHATADETTLPDVVVHDMLTSPQHAIIMPDDDMLSSDEREEEYELFTLHRPLSMDEYHEESLPGIFIHDLSHDPSHEEKPLYGKRPLPLPRPGKPKKNENDELLELYDVFVNNLLNDLQTLPVPAAPTTATSTPQPPALPAKPRSTPKTAPKKPRAVSGPSDNTITLADGLTAFAGENKFWAASRTAGEQSLVRVELKKKEVSFVNLAPASGVSTNGTDGASPLKSATVKLLALAGSGTAQKPVVVLDGQFDVYAFVDDAGTTLYKNDPSPLKDAAGADVDNPIAALAATSKNDFKTNLFFAAVPANTKTFADSDGENRGVAVMQIDTTNNKLDVITNDATNTNSATKLDVKAEKDANAVTNKDIAFYADMDKKPINKAHLLDGTGATMWWDENLKKLYVGLEAVTRGESGTAVNNKSGGVCSIWAGTVDGDNKISFGPVVKDADSTKFTTGTSADGDDLIVGFYRTNGQMQNLVASVKKLRTMHTSTGKACLLINGGVINVADYDDPTELANLGTKLYALPVVATAGDADLGLITQTPLPTTEKPAVLVGSNYQLLSYDGSQAISDIYVNGDTVFVALAGERDTDHLGEAGIFSSTALFQQDGEVRAWTPWQRVMGNATVVGGMGFDNASSNYWFLTGADKDNLNKVNITQWGMGDQALHGDDMATTLSGALDSLFTPTGGISSFMTFDSNTQGFKEQKPNDADTAKHHQQFALMTAAGFENIALIEAGKFDSADTQIFVPTTAFTVDSTAATPVMFFDAANTDQPAAAGLKDLGNITSVELSRLPLTGTDAKGWIFVGGQNGLAVLTQQDGSGWSTAADGGLAELSDDTLDANFPRGAKWQFTKLLNSAGNNPFVNIRKLISDQNKFLYALTDQELLQLEMTSTNFKADSSTPPATIVNLPTDPTTVAKISSVTGLTAGQDEFYDLFVVKRDTNAAPAKTILALGTSGGMFLTDEFADNKDFNTVTWKKVKKSDNATDLDLGPVLRFDFASTKGGNRMTPDAKKPTIFTAEGNLQALAFDGTKKILGRYRFDVTNTGEVQAFKEPYKVSGNPTEFFYTIGEFPKAVSAEDFDAFTFVPRARYLAIGSNGFAERMPQLPDPSLFLQDQAINLGLDQKLPLYLATMVTDPGSGALCVAGEFGVRVNE